MTEVTGTQGRQRTGTVPPAAVMAVAATLLAASLWGCGGRDATDDAPGEGDTATQPVTLADDGEGETTVSYGDGEVVDHAYVRYVENGLTMDMIPRLALTPDKYDNDQIAAVVFGEMSRAAGKSPVSSVELLASGASDMEGGGREVWASYLLHMKGGSDIGVEMACSSYLPPTAVPKDRLKVSDVQLYDVRTRQYVDAKGEEATAEAGAADDDGERDEQDAGGETTPQETPSNTADVPRVNMINPSDPYTYYDDDGNLQPLTEQSGPHLTEEERNTYAPDAPVRDLG